MSDEPEPRPGPRPPFGPQPLRKPARGALTIRDMLVALAVLAVAVLVFGGVTRGCSFSPGGPSVDDGALPVVDAPAQLRSLAPQVPFVIRIPAVPTGWRSNSVDQDRVRAGEAAESREVGRAVRTGYLTPEGRYLRLLQSDAPEEALLAVETGATTAVVAQGTLDVGGQRFVAYGAADDEAVWIAELPDGVRVLITGSGTEDDYRALAGAVLAGEALPVRTAPR